MDLYFDIDTLNVLCDKQLVTRVQFWTLSPDDNLPKPWVPSKVPRGLHGSLIIALLLNLLPSAQILALDFAGIQGKGNSADCAFHLNNLFAAYQWANDQEADFVNCSFGIRWSEVTPQQLKEHQPAINPSDSLPLGPEYAAIRKKATSGTINMLLEQHNGLVTDAINSALKECRALVLTSSFTLAHLPRL